MSDRPDGASPVASPMSVRTLREGATATVYLVGDLDYAAGGQVAAAVRDLTADGALRELVFDLAGVGFCDSSGISSIIKARHAGQTAGVTVRATAVQPPVAAVWQLTGIWSMLCTEPLPADAEQYFPHANADEVGN